MASIERVYLTTINYSFTHHEEQELLPSRTTSMQESVERILRSDLPIIRDLVEKLDSADLVVINGEGSVLEDQPNAKMIYMTCELAHQLGKECHLVNFTAHVTRPESVAMARQAFDHCASVSVREPLSYYVIKQFFPRVKLFPDIVCGLGYELTEPPVAYNTNSPLVMLGGGSATLRMTRIARGLRNDLMKWLRPRRHSAPIDHLKRKYARICNWLVDRRVRVCLMEWSRDEWLRELANGESVTYESGDFRHYFAIARQAAVNFTGRHHGCVISVAAGCPFITTTANCFKTYGDKLLYYSPAPVFELENLNEAEAIRSLETVLDRVVTFRCRAEARRDEIAPFYDGAILNMSSAVRDLVDAGLVSSRPSLGNLYYVQNMSP